LEIRGVTICRIGESGETIPKFCAVTKSMLILTGYYNTRHAVDNFIPSFLSTAGRGISPTYVADVLRNGKVVARCSDSITYQHGSLQVVVNDDGAVVTLYDRHN